MLRTKSYESILFEVQNLIFTPLCSNVVIYLVNKTISLSIVSLGNSFYLTFNAASERKELCRFSFSLYVTHFIYEQSGGWSGYVLLKHIICVLFCHYHMLL